MAKEIWPGDGCACTYLTWQGMAANSHSIASRRRCAWVECTFAASHWQMYGCCVPTWEKIVGEASCTWEDGRRRQMLLRLPWNSSQKFWQAEV